MFLKSRVGSQCTRHLFSSNFPSPSVFLTITAHSAPYGTSRPLEIYTYRATFAVLVMDTSTYVNLAHEISIRSNSESAALPQAALQALLDELSVLIIQLRSPCLSSFLHQCHIDEHARCDLTTDRFGLTTYS